MGLSGCSSSKIRLSLSILIQPHTHTHTHTVHLKDMCRTYTLVVRSTYKCERKISLRTTNMQVSSSKQKKKNWLSLGLAGYSIHIRRALSSSSSCSQETNARERRKKERGITSKPLPWSDSADCMYQYVLSLSHTHTRTDHTYPCMHACIHRELHW